MHSVLVVDDDLVLQQSLKEALQYHHFDVEVANNGEEALQKVYGREFDLVVMDVNMPKVDGITALKEMKKYNPAIIVLILTAYSNVSNAVEAVKQGAYNYIEKPILTNALVALIKRSLKARSLVETMAFSAPELTLSNDDSKDKFVGESNAMIKVFKLIEKLARVKTPVLIRGESGTGKELVAKAIHYNGPRKDEKFVTLNCAAIPENLIESELFGHEKGAFTGAFERKIGKFQYANGGTLFLDEIGDMSSTMQVKLLRVIQENSFTPVGSNREVHVDIRIIAASHRNFESMIKSGDFREDLFYRLNVLPVYLPPLRERTSDIPLLIKYYIDYFNNIHQFNIKGLEPQTEEILKKYAWPGNIRELRNVVEHAFIMESSDQITLSSLPETVLNTDNNFLKVDQDFDKSDSLDELSSNAIIDTQEIKNSAIEKNIENEIPDDIHEERPYLFHFGKKNENNKISLNFQVSRESFEKTFIIQALKSNRGKINRTALEANIPKKTLLRKIEKYNIRPKEFHSIEL